MNWFLGFMGLRRLSGQLYGRDTHHRGNHEGLPQRIVRVPLVGTLVAIIGVTTVA